MRYNVSMKTLKEIKTVGLRNWCWWVFALKRNEFSPRLDLDHYWGKTRDWDKNLAKDRKLAHEIELVLEDYERKT